MSEGSSSNCLFTFKKRARGGGRGGGGGGMRKRKEDSSASKGYFLTLFTMIIVIFTLLVLKQLHYFELLNVILSSPTMTKRNSLSLMNSHILFDDYAK